MDKLLYVGIITSFHGVKGELKIRSKLKNKKDIFKKDNTFIIDGKNYIVNSYRVHKGFDLVTFNDYNTLNDVEFLRSKRVFIDLNIEIKESKYRVIGYNVLVNDEYYGQVVDIVNYGSCDILEINNQDKIYNVAYLESSVLKINDINKEIVVNKEMIM